MLMNNNASLQETYTINNVSPCVAAPLLKCLSGYKMFSDGQYVTWVRDNIAAGGRQTIESFIKNLNNPNPLMEMAQQRDIDLWKERVGISADKNNYATLVEAYVRFPENADTTLRFAQDFPVLNETMVKVVGAEHIYNNGEYMPR